MHIPGTVCFVYFALLFGIAHANNTISDPSQTEVPTQNNTNTTETMKTTTSQGKISDTTVAKIPTASVCPQPTSKPETGYCILSVPQGAYLPLIAAALAVGCLAFLLTTLICACQVCQLKRIISGLKPYCDNADRPARKEKSESPCWDEGQVNRHPTETCFLLSEVTTAQEESKEDQQNKTEEENDTEQQPSTVKDPNGDIAQENGPEPDANAPESSDAGV